MKLPTRRLKLFALACTYIAAHSAHAQNDDAPDFFESDGRSDEERRQLYESSRGMFLDKPVDAIVRGSLVQQGFTPEYSAIKALEFLHRSIERDNGRHVIYLDISDQEFETLTPILSTFTRDIESETQTEITSVCNKLRAELAGRSAQAYDDAYAGYENSQLKASTQKQRRLNVFYADVERQLGIQVVDQLEEFVQVFSRTNTFSISLIPPASISSAPHTPTNYMNRICKSTLGG